MAKIIIKFPFDYSPRGGTIDELGACYVDEIKRIYEILNMLRENQQGTDEPQAHQLMINDNGNIYIRNTQNTDWVMVGKVAENFGLHDLGFIRQEDIGFTPDSDVLDINIKGNAGKLASKEISVTALKNNDALVYNSIDDKWLAAQVPVIDSRTNAISVDTLGNAAKIANKTILTSGIDDGEVLVYRTASGGFVNEPKAAGTGAGKTLAMYHNGELFVEYNGSIFKDIQFIQYTKDEPDGSSVPKPLIWLKANSTEDKIEGVYLLTGGSYKLLSEPTKNVIGVTEADGTVNVEKDDGNSDSFEVLTPSMKNTVNGVAGLDDKSKLLSSLYDFATKEEVQAGTDNKKPVNSAGVKQAVDAVLTNNVDYVIDSYRDGTSWYYKYKSGRVQQGGQLPNTATSITYLLPMATENEYDIKKQLIELYNDVSYSRETCVYDLTSTGCKCFNSTSDFKWSVDGMGAE